MIQPQVLSTMLWDSSTLKIQLYGWFTILSSEAKLRKKLGRARQGRPGQARAGHVWADQVGAGQSRAV